ncbi:uncharacterized protein V6R79_024972 [Siganus canaliculatus]
MFPSKADVCLPPISIHHTAELLLLRQGKNNSSCITENDHVMLETNVVFRYYDSTEPFTPHESIQTNVLQNLLDLCRPSSPGRHCWHIFKHFASVNAPIIHQTTLCCVS